MPVGTFISKDRSIGYSKRLVHKVFGTLDIHTHTRVRPLLKFIRKNRKLFENAVILELGCGSGINLFETFYINNSIRAVGIDADCYSIKLAEALSKNLGISNYLKFYCADLRKLESFSEITKLMPAHPKMLYLIDFIEHVENPVELLNSTFDLFREIEYIFISVPTYTYKKTFGEKFHREIGHVKDGYNLRELENMLNPFGFYLIHYEYNTGFLSNFACFLYYRIRFRNKYLNFLWFLVLYPFTWLDLLNGEKISNSLFAVFKKRK